MGSRSASSQRSIRDNLSPEWKRIAAFFEVLKEGIICADGDGTVLLTNQSAADLLSRDRSEMPGQSLFDLLPAGIGKAVQEAVTGEARGSQTFRGDQQGRDLAVSLSWLPEREEGEKLLFLTLTDETEKRQLEELRHAFEEKLQREQKLSDIGILASGIAHNLNGPLSIIVGYLDLLYSRASDLEEIPIILTQTERMKEIISNMMIKSRQEQDERSRMLNLNTLLKNELKFLDANLSFKHNIDKRYEFAVDMPEIYGVYSDFSQSFLNIINNALDAMVDSPVKKLRVRTRFDEENIYVEFRDTGCGLDPAEADNLFTPFYSTKPPVGEARPGDPTGTGLGLSSSYQLIKKYHGTILVDGSPNNGAHFTVALPIKENQPSRKADTASKDATSKEALLEA